MSVQESIHEGVRQSCDQCDYTAATSSQLDHHREMIRLHTSILQIIRYFDFFSQKFALFLIFIGLLNILRKTKSILCFVAVFFN